MSSYTIEDIDQIGLSMVEIKSHQIDVSVAQLVGVEETITDIWVLFIIKDNTNNLFFDFTQLKHISLLRSLNQPLLCNSTIAKQVMNNRWSHYTDRPKIRIYSNKGYNNSSDSKIGQSYPHRCPRCAGPAFIGIFGVDCQNNCEERDEKV